MLALCSGARQSPPALAVALMALVLPLALDAEELDLSRLPPPAIPGVNFARDIRPIFESACYRCHSGERPRSRYDLTDRESALRGGNVGVAIIPGDSAGSPLIHYVARLVEGMEGERPTLQWGNVRDTTSPPPVLRAIYPVSKQVEEQVHVLRLDVEYEIAGIGIEDNFRGEFADLRTQRENANGITLGAAQPDFVTRYRDGFRYFEGANTLKLEKPVNDWLFLRRTFTVSTPR